MSEEVDPVSSYSESEDEGLLFDREQLADLVMKYESHDKKISELEEKVSMLSFLFFMFIIAFASLAYVLLG